MRVTGEDDEIPLAEAAAVLAVDAHR